MQDDSIVQSKPRPSTFIVVAIVLGLSSGLLEGVAHVVFLRLNLLANVWYQIVWITALANGLVLVLIGAVLALGLSLTGNHSKARTFATFGLMFAACLPTLALTLYDHVAVYAIFILTVGISVALTRWFSVHEDQSLAFFRRSLPWVTTLTVLTFIAVQGVFWIEERTATEKLPAASASAPNILVIVVDALRSDHLSSYGYGRTPSPNIDKLAREGALFEHAFSTSSYTLPSHASLLTGLYPYQHGVEWLSPGNTYANGKYPTLPESLLGRGYRTAAFSGNTFWFTRAHGFGRGFLHFEDFFQSYADMFLRTAYGGIVTHLVLWPLKLEDIPARKRAEATNQSVLNWIGEDAAKPFFVFINYLDVHDPYLPPQPYRDRFSKVHNPGGLLNWEVHVPLKLTPDQLQSEMDAYDGALAYTDDQIDRLVQAIRQRDSKRDLMVVITADHGEEFNEHGAFLHGHGLFREVIQVPLIIWWPNHIPAATRISQPVSNSAIPATVLTLIGGNDAVFPGPPLEAFWNSPSGAHDTVTPRSELKQRLWEPVRYQVHSGSLRSMITSAWHYIEHDSLGPELYDLTVDPRETTDLAKKPEMRAVLDEFRKQLLD